MPMSKERRFPDWAEKDRDSDLSWIAENWSVFFPAAQEAYGEWGRGALVVDTTIVVAHEDGAGCPFSYLSQQGVEETDWHDLIRLVREYDPDREFVTVLMKTSHRKSAYRVGKARRQTP